ncbi:MAG: helix-turn-helix transcriptional regulator [Prevotella sp.]|jgi:transcriptional regulator with XRE-family HTH domain|nr:helix-turn-helix transcriptional regulator [Prevotella sp.]
MDTIEKNTHHGHAIKRIRKTLDMKQDVLADLLGITQSRISVYESKKVIEDDMIGKFAKALKIDPKLIKELEEDPVTIFVENNTFENNKDSAIAAGFIAGDNVVNNNPVDKIVELCEKLLEKEQEKIALLEKLLKDKK